MLAMTPKEENATLKLIERMRIRSEVASLKLQLLFEVLFAQRPEVKDLMLEALERDTGDEAHVAEIVRAWLKE
jgi:transcription termination factor NusB